MNTERIALLGRHVDAENRHDMDATLATLHRECVFEDLALQENYRGHEGAATYYSLWWDAFQLQFYRGAHSHIHWTTEDRCVAEGVFSGVHVGPFMGVEPTRAPVTYRFIVVVDFRDGLMAGERFYYGLEGIRRQIMAESRTRRA
jgi:steroid delta-isomerase-like uncharacterized protein